MQCSYLEAIPLFVVLLPPRMTDRRLVLQACGVLNPTGISHPFDEDGAKGYVRCEGVGAVVLRRLSDAERDGNNILALIPNAVAGSAGPEDGEGCGRYRRLAFMGGGGVSRCEGLVRGGGGMRPHV
jgi:hypothetical protein